MKKDFWKGEERVQKDFRSKPVPKWPNLGPLKNMERVQKGGKMKKLEKNGEEQDD